MSALIAAADLRRALAASPPAVVLDASFDLADAQAGRRAFEAAHVPGAGHVDLDTDLCAPRSGRNGRHPLPARADFARRVGTWGITPATPVVVMDRGNAMFAARLWWMLRWLGHADVRVLDGGWAAWQAAGGTVEAGPGTSRPDPGTPAYPMSAAPGMPTVDAPTLLAGLTRTRIVDARAPERYRGDVEPLDAVAGHIPGAANRPFARNLAPDGRFLDAQTLRAAWLPLVDDLPQAVVHQCGSGVTACHNLLATVVAGFAPGPLYPGSWSEWCADPTRPVARGDTN